MDQPALLAPRILFLDDNRDRAEAFLAENPAATWVETADECIRHLQDPWDEVHLDHDLGGEVFVDHQRADCGMEVVRWLCETPHPHLRTTQFIVHTHNPNAACIMVLHLQVMGWNVQCRPFGTARSHRQTKRVGGLTGRLIQWLSTGT